MARINIEDSLFKDGRFIDLCIKLGSRRAALGALTEAWMLAQRFVTVNSPTGPIPEEEWEKQGIAAEIVEVKLARKFDGIIEVSGAKDQFKWLVQRQSASAKGGEANARRIESEVSDRNPTGTQSEPGRFLARSPLISSLFSPSSFSSSDSISDSSSIITDGASVEASAGPHNEQPAKRSRKPKVERYGADLRKHTWDAYCEAYKARWEFEPDRNAAVNSQIKQLVEKVGEAAPDLVRFYLTHNDGFYVKACHPITLCLRDYVGLKTQMLRGQPITTADTRRLEKTLVNQNTAEHIRKVGI